MSTKNLYLQAPTEAHGNVRLGFRAEMALKLIIHFGGIAGQPGKNEDKSGRNVMELQSPGELVARCFQIADVFTSIAEERGELAENDSLEERSREVGRLDGMRDFHRFDYRDEVKEAKRLEKEKNQPSLPGTEQK